MMKGGLICGHDPSETETREEDKPPVVYWSGRGEEPGVFSGTYNLALNLQLSMPWLTSLGENQREEFAEFRREREVPKIRVLSA